MFKELVKDIFEYVDTKELDEVYLLNSSIAEGLKPHTHNYGLAEFLQGKNYFKMPEGSAVLDRREYQKYCAYKIIEPQIKGCLDRERELEKQLAELEEQRDRQAYITEELIQEKYRWVKQTAKEILIYLMESGVINTAPDTIKMYFKETYGVEHEI